MKKIIYPYTLILFIVMLMGSCASMNKNKENNTETMYIETNINGKGVSMEIQFEKGNTHNYPSLAFWIEDTGGNYIQTLYVTKAIATGIFRYGKASGGRWTSGDVRRPAALPYWSHKRGIKASDGLYTPDSTTQVPDAYSGATPSGNFVLKTKTDNMLNQPFILLMEINQPWDWNKYWHNNKYPDDSEYITSCQPALVYKATLIPGQTNEVELLPIGYSHYSGKDGNLNTDLSSISTALNIIKSVKVTISR